MKRVPIDENGNKLLDRWSEMYTERFAAVDATTGITLSFPVDVKDVVIHIEGTTVKAHIKGTAEGSDWIYLTSDGTSFTAPLCKKEDETLVYIKASSDTVNVSVMAGR